MLLTTCTLVHIRAGGRRSDAEPLCVLPPAAIYTLSFPDLMCTQINVTYFEQEVLPQVVVDMVGQGAVSAADIRDTDIICGSINARIVFNEFKSPSQAQAVLSTLGNPQYVSGYQASPAWTRAIEQVQAGSNPDTSQSPILPPTQKEESTQSPDPSTFPSPSRRPTVVTDTDLLGVPTKPLDPKVDLGVPTKPEVDPPIRALAPLDPWAALAPVLPVTDPTVPATARLGPDMPKDLAGVPVDPAALAGGPPGSDLLLRDAGRMPAAPTVAVAPPAPSSVVLSKEAVKSLEVTVGVVTTVAATVSATAAVVATVVSSIATTAAAAVTATAAAGGSVAMTVAAAAQQTLVVQQAAMAQPATTAARSAINTATAGLKAAAPGMSQVHAATKAASAANNVATKAGSGPSIFFTVGQMQMAGASGVFAPDEMSTFRAVAGSMEWTMQLPFPLWDLTSEWLPAKQSTSSVRPMQSL